MGYFPNGTAGDMYMMENCERCRNWRDKDDGRGPGCPVWDLHIVYNYDDKYKGVLDSFIPRDKEGWNKECEMFLLDPNTVDPRQMKLFLEKKK